MPVAPAPARAANWQRALIVLSGVTVAVVATAALYWAKTVLIPVALGVFIAFLLSPLVSRLQRRGLGRVPSVLLAVALAAALLAGIGWLVSTQVGGLAAGIPEYTKHIKERIRGLREMGNDSVFDQLSQMAREISAAWEEPDAAGAAKAVLPNEKAPVKVQVEPGPSWLNNILPTVPLLVEVAGSGALALVLAVFMLLKREDLRNRVIWLTGRGRVALTTKALDDIGHRISRYLLAQLAINGSYGIALALGLWLIGIDHWLLWGFLAGLLRYLPYIGAPIAILFPLALSLAQSTDWAMPLEVLGYFVFLEVIAANVVEPLLFGRSIGVSEVALLVAAGFWTFLWGPAGLLLSGPLTVCLVVVGEYVPALRFLAVILGDEPALEPDVTLFQRLAAGDQDEVMAILQEYIRRHSVEQVYDGLMLPALAHVRRALAEGELGDADERFILDAMTVILDDLADSVLGDGNQTAAAASAGAFQAMRTKMRIVACPARDEFDQLSLLMLRNLLYGSRCELEVVPVTLLAGELLAYVEEKQPAALCIGSFPPGGAAHTRYLCKRLRGRFPDLKMIVGRWTTEALTEAERTALEQAGADRVDSSLLQARDQLLVWAPVLEEQVPAAAPAPATGVIAGSPKE